MKKHIIAALSLAAVFTAAASTNTFILPKSMDGKMARLYNFDTEEQTDSAVVKDGKVEFASDFVKPYVASLTVDNNPVVDLYIFDNNGATVTVEPSKEAPTRYAVDARGGLNDTYRQTMHEIEATAESFSSNQANNFDQGIEVVIHDKILEATKRNISDPVGYLLVVMFGKDWLKPDMMGLIRDFPFLEKYNKVEKMLTQERGLKQTQPGKLYTNFDVTYDGTTHYLSDVVGKGDYVLVDFWASWCMPCRKEMRYIRKAQKEFEGKGLKVLGVAVWDEPAKSLAAAKDWGLPWTVWVNGTENVTDLYGIRAIPCVILFGPDGTILARDMRGDEIPQTVAKYIK